MSNVVIDVPANPEMLEDTPLVFSTANGNAITLSDPDSTVLTVYVAADGILHLGSTAGLTFLDGGDGSYGMEFTGTIADINAALDGLTYTPDPDIWGSGEIDITANDGSGPFTVQMFPTIDPVNDAPILTPFAPTLTAVQADNHNPAGQKVAAVFGAHIDDSADAFGLPYGIAITSITATGGTWQYSTDDGGTWTNFPSGISEGAALVLRDADYIRFLPDGTTSGVETFTYRAWDETDGSTTGTQVDITATGGETAFSTSSDTAHLTVNTTPRLQSVIATDASPTNASVVHYTVTFTVPVAGVDASQFLLTSTGGITGASIASVTGSGTTYSVAVNTGIGDGGLVLDVKGSGIHDLAGNAYTGGLFLAPATVTAGYQAWGVAIGDLNGDGKADVVTADEGDATLAVMLGNGDGTLHAPTFVGAVGPLSVAIGDVNGDGKMDLIATNWWANSISVLLGNGNGTFQAKQDTATGSTPDALAVGDFNGDHKLDVVAANEGTNNLSILLGNGDGTFAPASASPVGAGNAPVGVAVADVNNDGKQDIVAMNGGGTATVLLGNGDGTFTLKASPFVGANPQAVALADLNGDGKVDMVAADNLNNTVNILLGKGDGTFQNPVDYGAGLHPYSVAIGDVNGDGKLDLVLADDNTAGTVAILLGNGNGTFQSALTAAVGNTPRDAVLGDLNGDGFLDVVATNQNDNTVSVLLNGSASYTITDAAPSNAAPGSASVNENAAVVFDTAHGNVISVADTDNTTQTVTLHVNHGALSLAQTAGLSFTAGDGTADATMTFSGAITDINAALDGLIYAPGANYNGPDSISVLSDDGRKQDSNATSINIAPTNSAPTGTSAHVSVQEDHNYTFAAGDFRFSDPNDSPANALQAIDIATLPAAGTLTDNGVAVTAGQFISVADIAAGYLVYTPAADGNGAGYASFTFQVQDDGGTANGGIDTDPAPKTITVDVAAVDDAPTGVPANNVVAYTEGDGASALYGSLTIADADNPTNFAGGSVAASLNDARTGDVLSFIDGGPFSVSGTNVLFNATIVGSVTSGTYGTTIFTVTLNSAATLGVVEQLLENLGYASTSNDPTFGGTDTSRSIAVTFDDGGNTGSGSGIASSLVQVAITASNDAPVAIAPAVHYAATEQTTLDLKGTSLSVNDVDGGGGSETLAISVGEGTLTATQGDSGASVSGSGTDTLTISGTVDAINAFLNSGTSTFTYIDNTDTPSASTTLSLSIDDNGHTGIGGALIDTTSATIDISAVNDAPVLGSAGTSVGYTEGNAPVMLEPAITISDADSATLVGATISLSGFVAGDELRIDGSTSGNIVNGGNTIHYSYDSATGTLSLSGSDTVADYQAALRLVTYDSTSLNPTNIGGAPAPMRDVGWTMDDGAPANNHSVPVDTTIAITAVDSPSVAKDDHFTTDIATATGSGLNLFDDNGSGADSDPDGPALAVGGVNGNAGDVGTQVTLTSGALLTVNSDGTFSYDPNHAFDNQHLASTASGAANSSTSDSFQYTLAGGSTATVTVTVTVSGADDASTVYVGDASHADINGGPGGHLFDLTAAADYTVTGGSGNDGFKFADTFDSNDLVDGGGGTNNQMQVGGVYNSTIVLDSAKVTNVQVLAFEPGNSYVVHTDAGFVGATGTFTFWSVSMGSGNTVTIDGSAETDGGKFNFYLGQGNDTVTGGSGNDLFYGEGGADHLTGGAGSDIFAYLAPSDSNAADHDTLDFTAGTDKILLNGTTVSAVNTAFSGSLSAASLDSDLAALLGHGAAHELDTNHAVVVTGDSGGDLNGHTFLIVGTSGAASGYTTGADYVFDITAGAAAGLATTDFI